MIWSILLRNIVGVMPKKKKSTEDCAGLRDCSEKCRQCAQVLRTPKTSGLITSEIWNLLDPKLVDNLFSSFLVNKLSALSFRQPAVVGNWLCKLSTSFGSTNSQIRSDILFGRFSVLIYPRGGEKRFVLLKITVNMKSYLALSSSFFEVPGFSED
ncbi:hypothetical protein Y032_0371g132 [Ancylostoma ceylanicum]|uniref:Uncharacterized protein n=1 Tax=Ancylostoma ceylanicum TaxID=53326 RepID=A0A016RUA8_9BILA|nr:hypothetical protein Y032_0371g132 [Ancylostoma ceylanicum]